MLVFSSLPCPGLAGPFPGTPPPPALYQRSFRWFGLPACTASPEGQTSITGTARFVLATFYVTTTLLSGHTNSRTHRADDPGQRDQRANDSDPRRLTQIGWDRTTTLANQWEKQHVPDGPATAQGIRWPLKLSLVRALNCENARSRAHSRMIS